MRKLFIDFDQDDLIYFAKQTKFNDLSNNVTRMVLPSGQPIICHCKEYPDIYSDLSLILSKKDYYLKQVEEFWVECGSNDNCDACDQRGEYVRTGSKHTLCEECLHSDFEDSIYYLDKDTDTFFRIVNEILAVYQNDMVLTLQIHQPNIQKVNEIIPCSFREGKIVSPLDFNKRNYVIDGMLKECKCCKNLPHHILVTHKPYLVSGSPQNISHSFTMCEDCLEFCSVLRAIKEEKAFEYLNVLRNGFVQDVQSIICQNLVLTSLITNKTEL